MLHEPSKWKPLTEPMREIELLSHPILPIYLPVRLVQDVLNTDIVSVSHQVAGRERKIPLFGSPGKLKCARKVLSQLLMDFYNSLSLPVIWTSLRLVFFLWFALTAGLPTSCFPPNPACPCLSLGPCGGCNSNGHRPTEWIHAGFSESTWGIQGDQI